MACQAMHFWTFTGLVGAFLDLAIAYFLLCASAVAYFASKFLGFFGLSLPCPCDGLFVNPNSNYCLQRLLLDCPTEKVSMIQLSVRNKFPFDSLLCKDQNDYLSMKLVEDGNSYGKRLVELEGEASCSSIWDEKRSQDVVGRELVLRNQNGGEYGVTSWPGRKRDMKGKGITDHKTRTGFHRRRRSGFNNGKCSSASSFDQLSVPQSLPGINKEQSETTEVRSAPVDVGVEANCFPGDAPTAMYMRDIGLHEVELNQPIYEDNPKEKNESFDELRVDARGSPIIGDEINTIRLLEKALKEEHTAHAALLLELEKERNAAATAADEAMAMILRLQEEKASIEMQARQYQRIIEEKSAYDAEEMNILKEILLRREREKLFLEKEVETYRKMVNCGVEPLEGDYLDNQSREFSSPDLTEDTDLMLQELSESIEKKEMIKSRTAGDDITQQQEEEKHFSTKCSYDSNQVLQEKEMVPFEDSQLSQLKGGQKFGTYFHSYKPSSSQKHNLLEKTIPIVGEEQVNNGSANISEGLTEIVKTQRVSGICIQNDGRDLDNHERYATTDCEVSSSTMFDKEPHVHDVHIIDDNSNSHNEISRKNRERHPETGTSKVIGGNNVHDVPHMSSGLPPSGSRGKSLVDDLRRSSMSALDERLKIDLEVEWLREKLRTVQEGREKLNLSVGQEREKLQLQLLEDIACQLREIRHMTEPRKAIRQVSLPPPSSKVMSKKRRSRSAYLNNSS